MNALIQMSALGINRRPSIGVTLRLMQGGALEAGPRRLPEICDDGAGALDLSFAWLSWFATAFPVVVDVAK